MSVKILDDTIGISVENVFVCFNISETISSVERQTTKN